jgi:plasmid stabilization system protein ParE
MNILRSESFDSDLERQFRWYLLQTGLDPVPAFELFERFAKAVDDALDFLGKNPEAARSRFHTFPDLPGIRSWRLHKPFHRFLIFYRCEGADLWAERLLEGHRRLAGGS